MSAFVLRITMTFLFIILSSSVYAYDLSIVGVYRDTDCSISIKVHNLSDKRIPHKLFDNIRIKIYGEVVCRNRNTMDYKKSIKLDDFFMIPKYMSTVDTGLYINTEGNCKTNLKAELLYKDKMLTDEDLTNNIFSKNLTGPCSY